MRALVKAGPGPGMVVRDVPRPSCGSTDVLIRVHHAGVCGTDLHIWEWDSWASNRLKPPVVVGHEFAGEIVELGREAESAELLAVGDLVTAEGHIVCGHCLQCRLGDAHLCQRTSIIGVDRDGAFADFIVSYLNRNGRWASPKYVAGESYGTTRGAAIAHSLFTNKGTELNGLILISSALNFQTIGQDHDALVFRPGNDLPFMVFLPTYAATAWFHGRLSPKLQRRELRDLLDEVEEFAIGPYWSALARGDALEDTERKRVMAKLAAYTGLSADYIDRYNLRIHIHRFCKELMRDQRRTVGRLDSRFTGIDRIAAGENLENDPAHDQIGGPFTATLNDYLRVELGFENDSFYETLSMKVNESWDYEEFKGHYVDTSEQLRDVVSRSQRLEVFVASGYYDLATPHFATDYTISHLGLDESLRKNIRVEYYEAGHMMYLQLQSLLALAGHLRGFIEDTSS